MPDYKKMYLTLMAAVETAINLLIAAQNASEDIYVSSNNTEIIDISKRESHD